MATLHSSDPNNFAYELIAAWNLHDLPRVLSYYSQNLEFESPFISRVLENDSTEVRNRLIEKEAVGRVLGPSSQAVSRPAL